MMSKKNFKKRKKETEAELTASVIKGREKKQRKKDQNTQKVQKKHSFQPFECFNDENLADQP